MQKPHEGVLPVGGTGKDDGRAYHRCQRASRFMELSAKGPSVEKTLGGSNKVVIVCLLRKQHLYRYTHCLPQGNFGRGGHAGNHNKCCGKIGTDQGSSLK